MTLIMSRYPTVACRPAAKRVSKSRLGCLLATAVTLHEIKLAFVGITILSLLLVGLSTVWLHMIYHRKPDTRSSYSHLSVCKSDAASYRVGRKGCAFRQYLKMIYAQTI